MGVVWESISQQQSNNETDKGNRTISKPLDNQQTVHVWQEFSI